MESAASSTVHDLPEDNIHVDTVHDLPEFKVDTTQSDNDDDTTTTPDITMETNPNPSVSSAALGTTPVFPGDRKGHGSTTVDRVLPPSLTLNRLLPGKQVARTRSARSFSNCWQKDIKYTDAVIIGNGPSGICLSYFLSGHWPYYTGAAHTNEYLQMRLEDCAKDRPLVELDLEYLSSGLEGRSSNPVALLFDCLTHPDADMGTENASLLRWEDAPEKAIPHVVLGRKSEGGAWQMMEGEMQTLSLGTWMQLPNLPFKEWLAQYRSMKQEEDSDYYLPPVQNRASMQEVCAYYMQYVHQYNLSEYFRNYSTVTSVERVLDVCHTIDDESGEQVPCSRDHSGKFKWEVRGHQTQTNDMGELETIDFCYRAPSVVLATGSYDTPNKLGVPGENHDYVLHSLSELEKVFKEGILTPDSDPVMIVGAGLSAADAILFVQNLEIPIMHVFRRNSDDPRVILRQLPSALYPEYHHVLKMMRNITDDHGYEAHPMHQILECLEDGKVLIHSNKTGCETLIKVSYLVVLIGSRPNLSFLPDDGKNLGIIPGMNIDPKNNPVNVDPYTYQSVHENGLYAMGPLVGDNFVRFLRGGALGITSHMLRKKEGKL